MCQAKIDMELINNIEVILSTLRHELGNSINSLKITLDVLHENFGLFDDGKKKYYLKKGLNLVARQQKLIEAMKSYSRFNVKAQKEIPFLPFWEQFISMASNQLKDGNIKLIYQLEIGPCLIMVDDIALNKVMTSILDNAIEAVEDVDDPKIELKALMTNHSVMILVKDNGSGINKNDIPKMFIPLFTTKPGMMGMGLPIARKLLLKMEGRIEIKSLSGKGTEVRVWLKTGDSHEKGIKQT